MFFYSDSMTSPVPCGRVAPGAKKFCAKNKCGPCGFGQGNCTKDSQCAPGLVCVKNSGAQFNLPAKTNVCQ